VASRYVFDTGVLSLQVDGSPRARPYLEEVARGAAEGLVTDISLAELQYKLCQIVGTRAAEDAGRRIRNSPLRLIRSSPYLDIAWRFKCRYRARFSLADCVVLAVAQTHACRILTTDRSFQNTREPRVSVRVLPIGEGDESAESGKS